MAEKAHILVVEDDPLVLGVLGAFLIGESQTGTAQTVSDAFSYQISDRGAGHERYAEIALCWRTSHVGARHRPGTAATHAEH
jgi:hypothetical protein